MTILYNIPPNPYASDLRIGRIARCPTLITELFLFESCNQHSIPKCIFHADGEPYYSNDHLGVYYNQTWLENMECPHCGGVDFHYAYAVSLENDSVSGLVCPLCHTIWDVYDVVYLE